MKQKRIALKILLNVVYLIIVGGLLLNWIKKDRISDEFILFEMRMFQHIRSDMPVDAEILVSYCDSVQNFILHNKVRTNVKLNCEEYIGSTDLLKTDRLQTDFRTKVHLVYDDISTQETFASLLWAIVMIVLQVGVVWGSKMINKKFSD